MTYRILTVVLISIFLITGCDKDSAEIKIRRQIDEMAQAIEAKNGRDFIGHLKENFQDQDGRNKGQIRGMLAVIFMQHNKINISYSIDKVQVQGDSAQADILVKGSAGRVFNLRASRLSIQSLWKEHEGEWMLYRVHWEKLGAEEGN